VVMVDGMAGLRFGEPLSSPALPRWRAALAMRPPPGLERFRKSVKRFSERKRVKTKTWSVSAIRR